MDSIDRPTLSSAGDFAPLPAPVAPLSPPWPPAAPLLPPVGDFLRQVIVLGRRSIAPALPVLVLLYFYRFGMGLYMIFSGGATSPMGYPDTQLRAVTWIVAATAYMPLLVLVYTPFLPFQDALLRGERRSFIDAAKHVLERLGRYGISSFLQLLFIALPAVAVVVATGGATMALGGIPVEVRSILVLLAMIPAGIWVGFAMFLLAFATPLLILDGRGPVESIRESFALVRRNFGGLFWRFFVSAIVLTFAIVFASFPSAMLTVMASVAQQKLVAVEIARLVWDSAVSTLAFPFTVAVLLVLYRAVVPPRDETITTTSPYRFE